MNHAHWPLIVAPASLSDRRAPEVNTARDGQATLLEVTAPRTLTRGWCSDQGPGVSRRAA